MTKAISSAATPHTPDEHGVHREIASILNVHQKAGFDHGTLPMVRFGLPGQPTDLERIAEKVRYAPDQTIYINLAAINAHLAVKAARRILQNNPVFVHRMGPIAVQMFTENPLMQPTSALELRYLLSAALGERFVRMMAEHECVNTWLFNDKKTKNHADFAAALILGGIIEWFGRLVAPVSETVSPDVWKRYSEDPALADAGRTRIWFTSKAAYTIVAPILDEHRLTGLRYLLANPLTINRHFGLAPVPRYRARALTALAA